MIKSPFLQVESGGFAEHLFRVHTGFILIRNLFKMFSDTKNNNFMGTLFNDAQSHSGIKVQLVCVFTNKKTW